MIHSLVAMLTLAVTANDTRSLSDRYDQAMWAAAWEKAITQRPLKPTREAQIRWFAQEAAQRLRTAGVGVDTMDSLRQHLTNRELQNAKERVRSRARDAELAVKFWDKLRNATKRQQDREVRPEDEAIASEAEGRRAVERRLRGAPAPGDSKPTGADDADKRCHPDPETNRKVCVAFGDVEQRYQQAVVIHQFYLNEMAKLTDHEQQLSSEERDPKQRKPPRKPENGTEWTKEDLIQFLLEHCGEIGKQIVSEMPEGVEFATIAEDATPYFQNGTVYLPAGYSSEEIAAIAAHEITHATQWAKGTPWTEHSEAEAIINGFRVWEHLGKPSNAYGIPGKLYQHAYRLWKRDPANFPRVVHELKELFHGTNPVAHERRPAVPPPRSFQAPAPATVPKRPAR